VRFTSQDAESRYAALVAEAGGSVVGLDFDGTLAPIVDDPDSAHIHPDAPGVLAELSGVVGTIAVVTGRPADRVVALGGLGDLADEISGAGGDLRVFGQYGFERWSSQHRQVDSPPPPAGLAAYRHELAGVLRAADAAQAYVEDKGLAVAVHTRRLPDAAAAFGRLEPRLRDLAVRHELVLEPGRNVIEARSPGMDKGHVVRDLARDTGARGFLFAGDDLGDIEAFEAVADLRDRGLATLLVCSASDEESALVDRADVVVHGPAGVLDLLRTFTRDVRRSR
jgi:trehalose 6-phosphate phosphatase